ncbi:fimbrial protein [Stenotrophomonas sp. SY1]|uniref:fimbrial protein n=1 Tax=Stenotrophomonas sp. SY1 TaxID=477235 RepID=UPI001E344B7D|nr:fimbrial protein [Stenotrophomonas sp. SY1]MCD9085942.1 type 1 fimbrial protein [Stenotrophomonas sp. SY1]
MRNVTLLAVLMATVAPLAAHAADGTITFTGNVTDQTCTVSSSGGNATFTVNLPTVSRTSLAAAGATAGQTPFAINLSQCSAGNVATYFEPGASVDLSSGRLNNQAASGAGNVQIQLLGDNNQFLPVLAAGTGVAQGNSQWVSVAADGSANLNYSAEYYATGAATAGDVSTQVNYTIIYN